MAKSTHIIKSILVPVIVIGLASCTTKKSAENNSDNLTDLKDFPKEWVLAGNAGDYETAPDNVDGGPVILMNADSSFYGEVLIKQVERNWQMVNTGIMNTADIYWIKSCKRHTEGDANEMVYYDFDLQAQGDTTTVKLQVNFRHDPENPQTSVFFYAGPENLKSDVELIEKPWANRFQTITLEYGG